MIYCESVIVKDQFRSDQPTALLIVGDSPFEKLTEFFRERGLSLSSERSYALSIGRFIQWLSVKAPLFNEESKRPLLYTAYSHDLKFGVSAEEYPELAETWSSLSDVSIKQQLMRVLEFSDWLVVRYNAQPIIPQNYATLSFTEQLVFWRRWCIVKSNSIMAHLKSRSGAEETLANTQRVPHVRGLGRSKAEIGIKAFPVNLIDKLIWQGFKQSNKGTELWETHNLRDILITLLCLYGGCRVSEPMHLWVDDVCEDPNIPDCALVHIYEPSDGIVEYFDVISGSKKCTTRADYLKKFCDGKVPLTQELGRKNAGWKGCLLSDQKNKAFRVFWIDQNAGKLFYQLWNIYLQKCRPLVKQTPWAFLTKNGEPMGTQSFQETFSRAVLNCGVQCSKSLGTSTHGLRHRYGQWLNDLGIGQKEGQLAMHHLNAFSQDVYRQLKPEDVALKLCRLNVNVATKLVS